ncbi:MAG: apolipoprotein N-acyltransferase [Spirochaetota bacterium]
MLQRSGLLTLLSAVLFPLALPNELFPLGSPVLGLVALAPYYIALCETPDAKHASRLGALFGGVSTLIANYWLMFFGDYSIWTIGGTTIGYIGYNYVLAGFLRRATRAPRAYRPMLFALVWTLYEYLKSVGFLGYPWGLAAYPFNTLVIYTQFADVTGVWGLSLIAVYANATVAELVRSPVRLRPAHFSLALRNLALVFVMIAGVAVYGSIRLSDEIPIRDTVDVVMIQQNADSWARGNFSRPLLTAQRETVRALAAIDREPELIIWSETSLRYYYEQSRGWYASNPQELPFITFVSELPAPLLTGAPFQDPEDDYAVYNASILIGRDTEIDQWYGKRHLVPFAEAIPFWETAAVRRFFQDVVGISGVWTPGNENRLFEIVGNAETPVHFATPICFEDGFAYVNRRFVHAGADLIVNLTNNSWSRTDSAQLQHLVAARYRAIETRRGLVRSTNSGFTAVLDPWGRVEESIPMFETGHLVATVPVYEPETETVYMMLGDYLPYLIGVILAVLFVAAEVRKRAPNGALLLESVGDAMT